MKYDTTFIFPSKESLCERQGTNSSWLSVSQQHVFPLMVILALLYSTGHFGSLPTKLNEVNFFPQLK